VTHQAIIVLDFGSQYTQLIARRLRELSVYTEIWPFNTPIEKLRARQPVGIILSGGPRSVSESSAPKCDAGVLDLGWPVLGICYGMQLMTDTLGGHVGSAPHREFGPAQLHVVHAPRGALFEGVPSEFSVWASHGDYVTAAPAGFSVVATSANAPVAAMEDRARGLYALLFHPEVAHTDQGAEILRNFAFRVCGCTGDWTIRSFVEEATRRIRAQVGGGRVVCGLSGGVDSTVAALLIHGAIGDRLTCVFVDNGVLRQDEAGQVRKRFERLALPVVFEDASELFLARLRGVTDPEEKRRVIGAVFIEVFERRAHALGQVDFLGQGTLYPDVIESTSFKGPSVTIKSHHNVGGLKERMRLVLVEPLRELFKDEVRELGRKLGLPEQFIRRHPFPGPGLAVRILGDITKERCDLLREVDHIFIEELHTHNIYDDIWQAFAVLLPVKAVGVMGDERTYENVVALRAVTSVDGMTADWARIDYDTLAHISNRIIRNVRGVNRVTYDISSKPPATIEWE
jgi:GMP synthase (glutamine-hydrolysing)